MRHSRGLDGSGAIRHLNPIAAYVHLRALDNLQATAGISREDGLANLRRNLHRLAGAQHFRRKELTIVGAKSRVRTVQNAFRAKEIERQLENLWSKQVTGCIAIELLELFEPWRFRTLLVSRR